MVPLPTPLRPPSPEPTGAEIVAPTGVKTNAANRSPEAPKVSEL